MSWTEIVSYVNGATLLFAVFALFLFFSIFKGRQTIINITIGLYLALLISIEFPNKDILLGKFDGGTSLILAKIASFTFISLFTTFLCYRIMPSEFREEKFESIFKKIFLSIGATILTITIIFQFLASNELINSTSSLASTFSSSEIYFWWLLLPLVVLYIM